MMAMPVKQANKPLHLPCCLCARHHYDTGDASNLSDCVAAAAGELIDMWETLSGTSAVQTPAEVYASLAAEGFPVQYLRVPVTDGRAPQPCDIDAIVQQVRQGCTPDSTRLLYECQLPEN